MRRAKLIVGLATLVLVGGCKASIRSGIFRCASEDECPKGFVCRTDGDDRDAQKYCYDDEASGTSGRGGGTGGADAGRTGGGAGQTGGGASGRGGSDEPSDGGGATAGTHATLDGSSSDLPPGTWDETRWDESTWQ